jgi:hypothetical protein
MNARRLARSAIALALCLCASAIFLMTGMLGRAAAQGPSDIFIIKSSAKTPDAIVAAIKAYATEKKWQYLGDSKIKQGEITLVKICIPAVGQALWPAGPQLSAMLPCGNIGVYTKDARTEISILHPRYMHVLHPVPATEKASAIAHPLLMDMLNATVN